MKESILQKLNEQINAEFFSSNLYLSMSSWATSKGYKGIANWLRVQALEEHAHAMKFMTFIEDRNSRAEIFAVEKPETSWNGILHMYEAVKKHEEKITTLINELFNIAVDERDNACAGFLQWFVDEQVEEEATVSGIIDEIRLAGETGAGIYMIDKELGQRVFVDPTLVK